MKTFKDLMEGKLASGPLHHIEQIHKHLTALHGVSFDHPDLHRGLAHSLGGVLEGAEAVRKKHSSAAYQLEKTAKDAAKAKYEKANAGKSKSLRLDMLTHAHSAAMLHHLSKVKDSTETGPHYNITGTQQYLPAKKAYVAQSIRHASLNTKLAAKHDPAVVHAIQQHSKHVVSGDFKSAAKVRKTTNVAWDHDSWNGDNEYLRDLHKHAKSSKVGGTLGHFG